LLYKRERVKEKIGNERIKDKSIMKERMVSILIQRENF